MIKCILRPVSCQVWSHWTVISGSYSLGFKLWPKWIHITPPSNEIIMGVDVHANIGRSDDMQSIEFQAALGPYGFSKHNSKGEGLLTVYLAHYLRGMNTFFVAHKERHDQLLWLWWRTRPGTDRMLTWNVLPNGQESQDFLVADGFVSFTWKFRYLGLLISYNLRDDDDIPARITAANTLMDALKELWRNPQLDIYNKYLLIRAIPMNLLLWGAET